MGTLKERVIILRESLLIPFSLKGIFIMEMEEDMKVISVKVNLMEKVMSLKY